MYSQLQTVIDARDLHVAIVVSQYHGQITAAMCQAAVERFLEAGGTEEDLTIIPAAGSFELTAVCRAAARRDPDAIVAIGCVIAGETAHDQYIAQSVAQGLTAITVETGMPIGFGVLTCQSVSQARARAGGSAGNKGAEAMAAAIHTANTIRTLASTVDRVERG